MSGQVEVAPQRGPSPRWYWFEPVMVAITATKTRIYSHRRDADWAMAVLLLLLGAGLLQPGMAGTEIGTAGSWMAQLPAAGWGGVLIVIGLARIAAIKINGYWQNGRSALVRLLAAAFGMAFWATMGWPSLSRDLASSPAAFGLGTIVFGWLTWLEVRCAMRAWDDRRTIRLAGPLAGVPPDGA